MNVLQKLAGEVVSFFEWFGEAVSDPLVRDGLIRDLGGDPIAPVAIRAQREGWLYRELVAPHDPQLSDPVRTAAVLDELAAAFQKLVDEYIERRYPAPAPALSQKG